MNKLEAIEAMKKGHKVTHRNFADDEWVKSTKSGTLYEFEDGVMTDMHTFWSVRSNPSWEEGWTIFTNLETIKHGIPL